VGKRAKLEKPKLAESKFVIGLSATTLLLFFGWTVYMRYYFQFPSTLDDPLVPPYFKRAEDAKPFPRTLDPSQFLPGEVREAYSIAEEMPDVLAQQPSYCRRPVLRSLLDCFVNFEATNAKYVLRRRGLRGNCVFKGRLRRKFVQLLSTNTESRPHDRLDNSYVPRGTNTTLRSHLHLC
jgi:hypothetical protein